MKVYSEYILGLLQNDSGFSHIVIDNKPNVDIFNCPGERSYSAAQQYETKGNGKKYRMRNTKYDIKMYISNR